METFVSAPFHSQVNIRYSIKILFTWFLTFCTHISLKDSFLASLHMEQYLPFMFSVMDWSTQLDGHLVAGVCFVRSVSQVSLQ